MSLHRVLQDWGEGDSDAQGEEGSGAPAQSGDATWVYNDYPTYYWSQQGGLYEANATESIEVGDVGDYTWGPGYGGGPALDVAMWLDGSAPNYGWVIVGDESASSTAKRFDTRENPVEAYRPMLTLYYQPACTADWDSNGSINTLDVLGFLNEWVAQVPSADLDHSGSVDILDVLIFLNAWSTGC